MLKATRTAKNARYRRAVSASVDAIPTTPVR
jgi:hypothetical protein